MLKVNIDAKQSSIKNQFQKAYKQIQTNAEKGIGVTEIIFPNEIFMECRKMLNQYMESNNIKFVWMSIGGMNSISYGEGRLMKFKLLQ